MKPRFGCATFGSSSLQGYLWRLKWAAGKKEQVGIRPPVKKILASYQVPSCLQMSMIAVRVLQHCPTTDVFASGMKFASQITCSHVDESKTATSLSSIKAAAFSTGRA